MGTFEDKTIYALTINVITNAIHIDVDVDVDVGYIYDII